jgi:hypothetical protein
MDNLTITSMNRRAFLAASVAGAFSTAVMPPLDIRSARAKEALRGDKAAAWYRFKVGDMEATVVSDGFLGPYALAAAFYPQAPKGGRGRFGEGRVSVAGTVRHPGKLSGAQYRASLTGRSSRSPRTFAPEARSSTSSTRTSPMSLMVTVRRPTCLCMRPSSIMKRRCPTWSA